MKELNIQRLIMVALTERGCTVWRNNTGALKDPDGRLVRFGLCVGSSDIIGMTPEGKFLAIEVKTRTGRLSDQQRKFIDHVNARGGIAGVARLPQDALDLISG